MASQQQQQEQQQEQEQQQGWQQQEELFAIPNEEHTLQHVIFVLGMCLAIGPFVVILSLLVGGIFYLAVTKPLPYGGPLLWILCNALFVGVTNPLMLLFLAFSVSWTGVAYYWITKCLFQWWKIRYYCKHGTVVQVHNVSKRVLSISRNRSMHIVYEWIGEYEVPFLVLEGNHPTTTTVGQPPNDKKGEDHDEEKHRHPEEVSFSAPRVRQRFEVSIDAYNLTTLDAYIIVQVLPMMNSRLLCCCSNTTGPTTTNPQAILVQESQKNLEEHRVATCFLFLWLFLWSFMGVLVPLCSFANGADGLVEQCSLNSEECDDRLWQLCSCWPIATSYTFVLLGVAFLCFVSDIDNRWHDDQQGTTIRQSSSCNKNLSTENDDGGGGRKNFELVKLNVVGDYRDNKLLLEGSCTNRNHEGDDDQNTSPAHDFDG